MRITLDIKERLSIAHALSFCKGSYVKFVLAKDLKEKAALTAEEIQQFKIKDLPAKDGISWDNSVDTRRVFDITEDQFGLLVECLEAMNKASALVWDIIPFFEKIMNLKKELDNGNK